MVPIYHKDHPGHYHVLASKNGATIALFLDERQQSDFARPLDGDRNHALLFSRSSRTTSGNNLTAFVCELAKERNVLVVHISDFVNGQKTDLAALEPAVFRTTSRGSAGTGRATPGAGRTVSHKSFLSCSNQILRNLKSQKDCPIVYHAKERKVNASVTVLEILTVGS